MPVRNRSALANAEKMLTSPSLIGTGQYSCATGAITICLPLSYLCESGLPAVAALKTKYRSQLTIEKELRVSICNITPVFENLCSVRQTHGSHE